MDSNRPLFIPVILGTVQAGRMSKHAARLVTGELDRRTGLQAGDSLYYPISSSSRLFHT